MAISWATWRGRAGNRVRRSGKWKLEVHGDARLKFDGVSIVRVGFVTPLLHGIGRSLGKQWIARDELQRIYLALLVDDRLQYHRALQFSNASRFRISGVNAMNHLVVRIV